MGTEVTVPFCRSTHCQLHDGCTMVYKPIGFLMMPDRVEKGEC